MFGVTYRVGNRIRLRSGRCISNNTARKLLVLGIETSCDDTGIAVVNSDGEVLGETVISQQSIHLRYGGITPPRAQDLHRKNIEVAVSQTLGKADIAIGDVNAIAVTNRPGLPMSLLIGLRYGRHLARENCKPLVPVHHMEAHALAARMTNDIQYPFLCLLISGGHSQLALVRNPSEFYCMGESMDDAPGEAFDKVARRLKLQTILKYRNLNGGAAIELAAKHSEDPNRYQFPLPLARIKDCMFSFAGLKNSANRLIETLENKNGIRPDELIPYHSDFCAAFLKAVTRHLSYRTQRAIEFCKRENLLPGNSETSLVISGGVACNDFIFNTLSNMASQYDIKTYRPLKKYCSDNGVMIAWNGIENILHNSNVLEGDVDALDILGKCSLGISMIDDVRKAHIQCKWVQVRM